jgi:hypothetical protein
VSGLRDAASEGRGSDGACPQCLLSMALEDEERARESELRKDSERKRIPASLSVHTSLRLVIHRGHPLSGLYIGAILGPVRST